MTTGSGLFGQVMVAKETTYGTFATPTRTVEVTDESMSQDVAHIESKAIVSGQRVLPAARRIVNPQGAGGDLTVEIATEGMGWLFESCLGASAVSTPSGATDARQQSFTLGDATGSYTIQAGRPGVDATVHPFNYLGCVVTDWELDCKVDEIATLKTTWDAREEETTSALGTAAYAMPELLTYAGGTITIAGSAVPVSSLTISGKRALKTDRRFLGDSRKLTPIPNGRHEITIKVDVELDGVTLYNHVKSGDSIAFDAVFLGSNIESTFDNKVHIVVPACQLDGDTPNLSGPDVIPLTLTLTLVDNGTDEPITLDYFTTDTAV